VNEFATLEDLLYVVAVMVGGIVGASVITLLVGVILGAPSIASATGAAVLFGMVAHLAKSPRAKRVARTPISRIFRRSD
jgi:hypothetical protein